VGHVVSSAPSGHEDNYYLALEVQKKRATSRVDAQWEPEARQPKAKTARISQGRNGYSISRSRRPEYPESILRPRWLEYPETETD
jgi:hypothetical protein